jgi:hypothetical protein
MQQMAQMPQFVYMQMPNGTMQMVPVMQNFQMPQFAQPMMPVAYPQQVAPQTIAPQKVATPQPAPV